MTRTNVFFSHIHHFFACKSNARLIMNSFFFLFFFNLSIIWLDHGISDTCMNRSTYRNNHSLANMMMIDNRLENRKHKEMTFPSSSHSIVVVSYRSNNWIAVCRVFEWKDNFVDIHHFVTRRDKKKRCDHWSPLRSFLSALFICSISAFCSFSRPIRNVYIRSCRDHSFITMNISSFLGMFFFLLAIIIWTDRRVQTFD